MVNSPHEQDPEQNFAGQTVLITGAAGGFGRSAARLFAEHGANLVLADYNAEALAECAAALESHGFQVATLAGSVADEAHCKASVDLAMERFERLDVAINNAGISHAAGKVADLDSRDVEQTVQVNLMGVFYGMKHQIPAMQESYKNTGRPCNILNVASAAGLCGAPTISMYAAAKHGVVGLTRSAALEYARRGIRINAICPAFARTPLVENGMLAQTRGDRDAEDVLTRGVPMRRLAEPEEITRTMLWICDPRNSFMTGEALSIDGGISAM